MFSFEIGYKINLEILYPNDLNVRYNVRMLTSTNHFSSLSSCFSCDFFRNEMIFFSSRKFLSHLCKYVSDLKYIKKKTICCLIFFSSFFYKKMLWIYILVPLVALSVKAKSKFIGSRGSSWAAILLLLIIFAILIWSIYKMACWCRNSYLTWIIDRLY